MAYIKQCAFFLPIFGLVSFDRYGVFWEHVSKASARTIIIISYIFKSCLIWSPTRILFTWRPCLKQRFTPITAVHCWHRHPSLCLWIDPTASIHNIWSALVCVRFSRQYVRNLRFISLCVAPTRIIPTRKSCCSLLASSANAIKEPKCYCSHMIRFECSFVWSLNLYIVVGMKKGFLLNVTCSHIWLALANCLSACAFEA